MFQFLCLGDNPLDDLNLTWLQFAAFVDAMKKLIELHGFFEGLTLLTVKAIRHFAV